MCWGWPSTLLGYKLYLSRIWALVKKIRCNPGKSQVLYLGEPESTPTERVHLRAVRLRWFTEVEYLGLQLTRDGFLGKEPKEV